MNRKTIIVLISVILVLILRLYCSYTPLDGITGMLWGALPGFDDTVYAPGYTATGFRQIKVGMTRDQSYSIIGEPLDIWTNQDETVSERWSKSPNDTNYRTRVLVFSNSYVNRIFAEYYFD